MARCTWPTSTTRSSGTTSSRSTTRVATGEVGASGGSCTRAKGPGTQGKRGRRSDADGTVAERGLRDASPHVRRVAVEALGRHPAWSAMRPLLELRSQVPPEDTHLLYTVRVALRDHLRDPAI